MKSFLKAGFSAVNITPHVGCNMGGMGRVKSESIHDDLHARVMVLEYDGTRVVFVSTDLVALGKDDIDRIKALILTDSGIMPSQVCISALHNHNGPLTYNFVEWYDKDPDYMNELVRKIAGAVHMAAGNLNEARVGFGVGQAALNVNRRVKMPDGSVRMLFDTPTLTANPDLKPNGPVDREVGVMALQGMDGRTEAILVNYSAHVICAAKLDQLGIISADYPGVMVDYLKKKTGAFAMHTNGACGDVHPLGFSEGMDRARETGEKLAAEVLRVLGEISYGPCHKLAAIECALELPYNNEFMATGKGRLKRSGDRSLSVLQVMAVNDAAFVNVPAELFVEFGLEIKKKSPFKQTFIISNANDYLSYIPGRDAFEEGGKGPDIARHIPESGEMIVEKALSMLRQL